MRLFEAQGRVGSVYLAWVCVLSPKLPNPTISPPPSLSLFSLIPLSSPSASAGPIARCYTVSAVVKGCLRRSGIRPFIYRMAHTFNGLHTDDAGTDSLKYVGEDLHVLVAFKLEDSAHSFQRNLCELNLGSLVPGVQGIVKLEKALSESRGFARIWADEYQATDSTSPTTSILEAVKETASETATTVSFQSPEAQYQSIENPVVWTVVRPEKLHLISAAVCKSDSGYKKYNSDKNNLISASHLFHEYFDGLSCDHEMVIMSKERVGDKETIQGGGSRVRVYVILTFLRDDVRDVMVPRLQVGMDVVSAERRQYRVSLLVENPKIFLFCLDWKMKHTIANLQKKKEENKYIGQDFDVADFLIPSEEELDLMDDLENLSV